MKRRTQQRNSILVLLACMLVLGFGYQNCSPGFKGMLRGPASEASRTDDGSKEPESPQVPTQLGLKAENPFTCAADSPQAKTPLKRLTKTQYTNTLRALVGATTVTAVSPMIESLYTDELKKSVGDFSNSITDAQMSAYQKISEGVQQFLVSSPTAAATVAATALGEACFQSATVTATCRDSLINRLGLIAFRRPLLTTEVAKWAQVYQLGSDKTEGLALVVYGLTMAPEFLLHLELGRSVSASDLPASDGPTDSTSASNVFELSPYEVAARIAYGVTDSPPDAALLSAASRDELKTPRQIESHVDRLMQTASGKAKIMGFIKYWVDPQRYSASGYSSDFLQGLNVATSNEEFERELYEYADYVIFKKMGTFDDLIFGRESFARTATVAAVYGHEPVAAGAAPALMDARRQGLLMRTPVLAGDSNENHPIMRGAKFRNRFLCESLGLPIGALTNDATFISDGARSKMSTRDRMTGLTSQGACLGCHAMINPVGFAFENLDNFGRIRATERAYSTSGSFLAEHEISTASSGVNIGGDVVNIEDGLDLIRILGRRNQLPGCFVRQVARFYRLQEETSFDGCLLKQMYEQSMIQPNRPVLDVFRSRYLHSTFVSKRIE